RSKIGKGNEHENQRVKRRHDAVVKLRAQVSGVGVGELAQWLWPNQLPNVPLANGVVDGDRTGKLREVESVAIEHDNGRRDFTFLVLLYTAFIQHEKGARVVLENVAPLSKDGDALVLVALVVYEHSAQFIVGQALADVKGDAFLHGDKAAGAQRVSNEIGAHFGDPAAERAQAFRGQIGAQQCDEHRYDGCRRKERLEEAPGRHAGSVNDDDFRIRRNLVEHVANRDGESQGRQQPHQIGDD